jgi:hypothetical protein
LPPLAAVLFGRWRWPDYRRYGAIVAASAALLLVPSAVYMVYQEINPPEGKVESVEQHLFVPENNDRLEQIGANLETYVEASFALLSPPLIALLLVLGIWQWRRIPRAVIFLLAFTLLIWVFITLTAARPSTRYLVIGVPGLLILVAAGLDTLLDATYRQPVTETSRNLLIGANLMAALVLVLWAMYGGQFITTAWDDPADLPLADRDIWEYYENSASGYALREAAADLPGLPPLVDHPSGAEIPVAGFVGACHTMRLYLPDDSGVRLWCPYFRWNPNEADATLAEWEGRFRDEGVWYVLADLEQPMDVLSLPLQWQELVYYPRPFDGIDVKLFRVTPLEEAANGR